MDKIETASSEFTVEQKSIVKQLGRRRVYIIFMAFVVVALGNTIADESDQILHAFDDYSIVALAIVAVVVLAVTWRRQSLASLKRVNNIAAVISVIFIPLIIFAITQEINDPTDFGNEIPSLLFAIVLVINRFV